MSGDGMLTKMYKIVLALMDMKDAAPFKEPVDWQGLGLNDYPIIVQNPMDLGTIKERLEHNFYQKHQQVAEDIRLVWKNCKAYNQEDSIYWKIADKLSQRFEDRYIKVRAEELGGGGQADDTEAPTLEEKRQFRANLYRITSDDLGEIVKILEEKSPDAMDRMTGKDEIEINIDKISPPTFHLLADLIRRKIPDKKAKKKKLPGEVDPLKKNSMLTEEQKQQIEKNRLAALKLREQKARERAEAAQASSSKGQHVGALKELSEQGGFCSAAPASAAASGVEASSATVGSGPDPTPTSSFGGGHRGGCTACGQQGMIDDTFLQKFEVRVCLHCKAENDDYRLMSKGEVASEFLLQEGTIAVLPYLERRNPRNPKYQTMKLFLRKQAREQSYARWGGEEQLEEERARRNKRKYEAALQKTASIMKKQK